MNSFHVIASLMIFLLWTGWVPSSLPGMAAARVTRDTAVVPLVDLLKADGSLDFTQGYRASNRVQTSVWTPSLALTKKSAEAVQPGHLLEAHLILHNDGTMPLTGVALTDTLPAGTTFASASDGGILNDGIVTWQVGDLAVGATVTRTCTVDVPTGAVHGALLINTAGAVSDQGMTATASRIVAVDALAPAFPYLPFVRKE